VTPVPTATTPRKMTTPKEATGAAKEEILMVQEPGRPDHKCKVLRSWKTADGGTGYYVQATDTGEFMTVVEHSSVGPMPGAKKSSSSGAEGAMESAPSGNRPGYRVKSLADRIVH